MWDFLRKLTPVFLVLVTLALVEGGFSVNQADARSFGGGRSFRMTPKSYSPKSVAPTNSMAGQKSGGTFSRGLMGGLVGGALGGMLFGSMFGAGGSGMGLLPLLLIAGGGFFLYRKFSQQGSNGATRSGYQQPQAGSPFGGSAATSAPLAPDFGGMSLLDEGLAQIRESDPGFDPSYFKEIASDVFFQVQAGWMRRDLNSYKHLLGTQLASEYAVQFEKMKRDGHINKLESIAVRTIEITEAGSNDGEDFVTVRFVASLLDYTVDDKSGDVIDGSTTQPIKFEEDWTWARQAGTDEWKLEGIK